MENIESQPIKQDQQSSVQPEAPLSPSPFNPGIRFEDIKNKDPFTVSYSLRYNDGQTTLNYREFWIAPFKCEVIAAALRFEEKCSSSGRTIELRKIYDSTFGSIAIFDISSTTNETTYFATLSTTKENLVLERGHALSWRLNQNAPDFLTPVITVTLCPLARGDYRKNF